MSGAAARTGDFKKILKESRIKKLYGRLYAKEIQSQFSNVQVIYRYVDRCM